jgi:hypothetical protein
MAGEGGKPQPGALKRSLNSGTWTPPRGGSRRPAMKSHAMDGPDASEPNLYIAWYEAWRAEQDARRAAESAAKLEMQRGIRWLIVLLVAWAVAAAIAGGIALALWTGA